MGGVDDLEDAADARDLAPLGLTFDDVLLVPVESDVVPSEVDTPPKLPKRITLRLPLWSPRRWTR